MDVRGLETYTYVPIWNDNRSLPKAEQVEIDIGAISARERLGCIETYSDESGHMRVTPDFPAFIRAGVKAIRNLSVEGNPLSSAEELLRSTGVGIDNLVREVGSEIFFRSHRGVSKN